MGGCFTFLARVFYIVFFGFFVGTAITLVIVGLWSGLGNLFPVLRAGDNIVTWVAVALGGLIGIIMIIRMVALAFQYFDD